MFLKDNSFGGEKSYAYLIIVRLLLFLVPIIFLFHHSQIDFKIATEADLILIDIKHLWLIVISLHIIELRPKSALVRRWPTLDLNLERQVKLGFFIGTKIMDSQVKLRNKGLLCVVLER